MCVPSNIPENDDLSSASNHDITVLLARWSQGEEEVMADVLDHAYDELRALARNYLRRERAGHTFAPTALVNEAYLRILGNDLQTATVENRRHFFALVARAMRRILVEHARRYQAARRFSPTDRVPMEDEGFWAHIESRPEEVLALDQALERLRTCSPRQAQVVELRHFGGLTEAEVAEILEVSLPTVKRDWKVARLMLFRALRSDGGQPN